MELNLTPIFFQFKTENLRFSKGKIREVEDQKRDVIEDRMEFCLIENKMRQEKLKKNKLNFLN